MRKAYGILGVLFLVVLIGAFFAFERAEAPTEDGQLSDNPPIIMSLTLMSPAFGHNEMIPSEYTCDGPNINPELHIAGVPEGTQSLVLLVDDPDIPEEIKRSRGIEKFDHWVLYNIAPETTVISEDSTIGSEGLTSRGEPGYVGACPPPEYEPTTHRYIFTLYALSGTLNFITVPTYDDVRTAAEGMTLEKTELIGRYKRVQ